MVLYKYLHKHGLRFLSSLKLKLTSPADVDDPFEMRPRVGSSEVTDEMMKRLLAGRDRMKVFFQRTGQPDLDEWIASCRKDPRDLHRWLSKKLPEGLKAYCEQAPEAVAEEYRMLCFSNSCDNILLWSHYGDRHHGIVVGFDRDGLEDTLGAISLEVECREDRTIYGAEQFLFPTLEYARQLLTRKSPSWSYQEEVRFVVEYQGNSFFDCPPHLIKSVLLGCKFPAKRITCVKKLMARRDIQAKLLCGIPDENRFQISFGRET